MSCNDVQNISILRTTRHYDWPGGKDGWDSVNDWNVVSYNIISNLSLSYPLYLSYPRATLCWTGAPILSQARGNIHTTRTTQIWSHLPWVTISLNSFNLDTLIHRYPRCLDDQRGGQACLLQSERVGPPPLGGAGGHGLQPNPRWVVRVYNSLLTRWGTE